MIDTNVAMNRQFELFRKVANLPHSRGALWWANNDLIKERNKMFNQNDTHEGHPLLSVSQQEPTQCFDTIPMLVGTTGKKMSYKTKQGCVCVVGMTKCDPTHETYFGSIIQPGRYGIDEILSSLKKRKHQKWTMRPNKDKPMVSADEKRALDDWCEKHGLL